MSDLDISLELAAGRKAFDEENYILSASNYEKVIHSENLLTSDLRKYAFSLMEQFKYQAALVVLKKWESIEQNSPVLYSMLSHCLQHVGQLQLAITALEKSLDLKPRPSGYCKLAALLLKNGESDQSAIFYKKALELDSKYEEASHALFNLSQVRK